MASTYQLRTDGLVIETEPSGAVWTFSHHPDTPIAELSGRAQRFRAWLGDGNTPAPVPPPPIVYNRGRTLDARMRTTNATPTELYRATLAPLTAYVALLELLAVDAGNGAIRSIRASISTKRLGGGALLIGAPVVIANHQDTAASAWAISATADGNDFVITVTGAAGRNIDWLLSGSFRSFTPGGEP